MTVSIKKRIKSSAEYYVYYNDWTGEVISIGRSVHDDISTPYFVTSDETAQRIVRGQDSEQNYIVGSIDNQVQLLSKSESLRLRQQEDALFMLPAHKITDWDVRVRLYTKNMMLVTEVNQDMISRLVAHKMRRQIQVATTDKFEFYIIKKDTPDFLVDTINIDPDDLIRNGQIVQSVADIVKHVDLHDLCVLTRRIFKNYYFEIIDDSYVDTSAQADPPMSLFNWQVVDTAVESHIRFTQHGNYVIVNSIVSAEQLDAVGIHTQVITFYVVGETPDVYLGKFSVDMSRVRVGQIQKFNVDFDIYNATIIYQNPRLKVSKMENK
tara:strand:+ start:540 stop:1508 length:969 start_codon:yes stop_codon:yes gene_type:complete